MDPIVGQIILFGGNFAPCGWSFCDGQMLQVADNEPLFAILGTTYGGDGQSTFCLPDLRGRVPMHAGHAPELSPREIGQKTGTERVSLTAAQLPEHRHEILVSDATPNSDKPSQSALGAAKTYVNAADGLHRQKGEPTTALNSKTVGLTGGSAPHDNMQPTLCLNYIIAVSGTFPSRS